MVGYFALFLHFFQMDLIIVDPTPGTMHLIYIHTSVLDSFGFPNISQKVNIFMRALPSPSQLTSSLRHLYFHVIAWMPSWAPFDNLCT